MKKVYLYYFINIGLAEAQIVASQNNIKIDGNWDSVPQVLLWLSILVMIIALITLIVSIHVILLIINKENERLGYPKISLLGDLWEKIDKKYIRGEVKPVEQETYHLLPNSYDGICELNNPMPPWLRNLFYGTITFSIIYLAIYFVFKVSPLQIEEYEEEIRIAQIKKEEHLKKMENSVDENSVKSDLNNIALIDRGKKIFISNCKACHGEFGEGGVGPNLTDSYWLHGNKINDIFKTIKYGVPAKGMIAWQSKLTPMDIAAVSNYILTLQGTNPPNAKQPEGKNYNTDDSQANTN